jgi:hypothetical protein
LISAQKVNWHYGTKYPISPIQNNQCSTFLNSSLNTFDNYINENKHTNNQKRDRAANNSLWIQPPLNQLIMNQMSEFPNVSFGQFGLNLHSDNIDIMEIGK